MKRTAIFLICTFFSAPAFTQSFQVQKKQFNGTLIYGQLSFDEVFDNDGEKKTVKSVRHQELNLQMCYGLMDNTEVYFTAPFISNSTETTEGKENIQHTGDITAGIRWSYPLSDKHRLGIGLQQSMATGKRDPQNFLHTGYVDNHTGLWLFYRSLFSSKYWLQADAGYVFHYNAFSNEFRASITGRFRVYSPLYLELKLEGRRPFENEDVLLNRYDLGLFQDNSGCIAGGIALRIMKENKPGLVMGLSNPIRGQFIPAATYWYAGIIWYLSKKQE